MVPYIILALLLGVGIGMLISNRFNRIYDKAFNEAMEYWGKYLAILGWIADTPVPYSEEEYAEHLRKLQDIITGDKEESREEN